MAEIDASLTRLGTDFVDLYQIHRFDPHTCRSRRRWRRCTDVVKAGKALYIGASSMHAWQFCKALQLSDRHGWSRFVSMQNHYNLMYREEEREMIGLCLEEGVGVIPWSPLARGKLTRPWADEPSTKRGETDAVRQDALPRHATPTRGWSTPLCALAKAALHVPPWRRWRSPGCSSQARRHVADYRRLQGRTISTTPSRPWHLSPDAPRSSNRWRPPYRPARHRGLRLSSKAPGIRTVPQMQLKVAFRNRSDPRSCAPPCRAWSETPATVARLAGICQSFEPASC